jgi:hypothetical protein
MDSNIAIEPQPSPQGGGSPLDAILKRDPFSIILLACCLLVFFKFAGNIKKYCTGD